MTPRELMRRCRRDHARRAELQSVIAEGGVVQAAFDALVEAHGTWRNRHRTEA